MTDNNWILDLKPKDEFEFGFAGWEKHQKDMGGKKRHWIKLDVSFHRDRRVDELGLSGKFLFVILLTEIGQCGANSCLTTASYLSAQCHTRASRLPIELYKMAESGLIFCRKKERKKEKKEITHDEKPVLKNSPKNPPGEPPVTQPVGAPKAGVISVLKDNQTQQAIACYCAMHKARYTSNPPITGKVMGVAKRLVKDHGLERALELIQVYLQMNDADFSKASHPLPMMEFHINRVATSRNTGHEKPEDLSVVNMLRAHHAKKQGVSDDRDRVLYPGEEITDTVAK